MRKKTKKRGQNQSKGAKKHKGTKGNKMEKFGTKSGK